MLLSLRKEQGRTRGPQFFLVVVSAVLMVTGTTLTGGAAGSFGDRLAGFGSTRVAAAPDPPGPPTLGRGSVRLLADNDYALFVGDVNTATQLLHQNSVGWQDQVTSAASVALDAVGDYVYLVAMGGGVQDNFGGTINNVDLTTLASLERAVAGTNCGGSVSGGWFLITGCIDGYAVASAETGAQNITLQDLQTALTGVTWGLMPQVSSRTDAGDTACWVGGQATFEDGVTPTNRCYTIPTDHAVVVRFPKSAVGLPVPGNGQVTVFWNAPTSGGTPTSYLVTAHLAADASIADPVRSCAPSTLADLQCTVTGLTNGTAYKFRVVAINGDGSSAPSPFTLPQTPVGPPAAPAPPSPPVGEVMVVLPPPTLPPPTTPPATTVPPSPVAGVSGVVSRVPLGECEVVACAPVDGNGVDTASTTGSNCVAETVEVLVENFDQDLVVRGAEFNLRLKGECASACRIASDDAGGQILELEVGGRLQVAGAGFVPSSTANVWLFSDPKFLGSVEVNPDGSFAGSLSIGQIEVGEHTIQVNGVSADGRIRAVSLGVMIRERLVPEVVPELPQAGVEQGDRVAAWSVLFLALGAFIWLVARRPEEDYSGR